MNTVKIPDDEIKHNVENETFKVEIQQYNQANTIMNGPYGTFFVILDGEGQVNQSSCKKGDFGFVTSDENEINVSGAIQIAWIILV